MTALLIGYAVAITIVFFASRTIPNLPALPSTERPIKVPFVGTQFGATCRGNVFMFP
jgi:hypothetical protein